MKITNKVINDKVQALQNEGLDIGVDFAGQPSRPRITNKAGSRDLSDRMSATETHTWLAGFVTGLELKRTQAPMSDPGPDVNDGDDLN